MYPVSLSFLVICHFSRMRKVIFGLFIVISYYVSDGLLHKPFYRTNYGYYSRSPWRKTDVDLGACHKQCLDNASVQVLKLLYT